MQLTLPADSPMRAPDFLFGVATSAFQIEGAAALRRPCIWDSFCATPGKIRDGSDGLIACDHYSRWQEDLGLLAQLGVDAIDDVILFAGHEFDLAGHDSPHFRVDVGLNVAADAFINSAITGANGGLIVVVADDPSMHSSQNEQDSRFYGKFAMIPILEPSNQQEAY